MKIYEIELLVSNYEETVSFYKDILEFHCLAETTHITSFQAGSSVLTLHKDEVHSYYYHFAFNIPPNLFETAKSWMQGKIPLLLEEDQDEITFTAAKAKSFYFEDPAGNIVEYIARSETTPVAVENHFNPNHVLGISEIGLSAEDTTKCVEEIQSFGIPSRNNEPISYNQYLNFMGEYEDGVYIIVAPLGRRWIFSRKTAIIAPTIIKTNRGTIKSF